MRIPRIRLESICEEVNLKEDEELEVLDAEERILRKERRSKWKRSRVEKRKVSEDDTSDKENDCNEQKEKKRRLDHSHSGPKGKNKAVILEDEIVEPEPNAEQDVQCDEKNLGFQHDVDEWP